MSRMRIDRVNAHIQKELGLIIHEESEDISRLVSITRVETAPDLKSSKIFISALGTPQDVREIVRNLNKRRSFWQRELKSRLTMKFTPIIVFMVDELWLRGRGVEHIIDKL